ncbi:tail fiber domain-containing protein [Chitinophaga sp. RAB17]|uniref:tail fiber domain-containing protein n=1 Tax=Chitinophaga sp. RAB17 TaxID=3233049 RepID=UPI003F9264CD
MKFLFRLVLLCLLSSVSYAQTVYQIRADSVRIYSACDTAELIIENHTQDTTGFLFNKGKGRTEFRKLRLKMLADNSLAIVGQDTVALGTGFVRLQTAINQPGGFSVSGSGFSTAQFQVKRDGSDAVSGGLALFNAIQTRGAIFQLNGDVNPGVSTWIHSGSTWVKRMEINSGSGVVDMPYGFIGGNTSKIRGIDTLDFTQSYLQFMRSDGATRMGLVGMASKSNKDVYLISDQGKVNIYPNNNSLTGYLSVEPNNLLYSGGTVTLANATSNMLSFVGGGTGVPSFLPRSVGTKLVLGNTVGSASVDHAMGVESSNTWFSVPQQNSTFGIKFYGGATEIGRISGVGLSEWAGQGRFKGWADTTVRGVAAEVGMIYGAATFIGADRTVSPAKYLPVVIRGGSSATNSKGFGIDSIGYRFIEFRNVGVLGTDANGYLVSKMPLLSDILGAGNQTGNNLITFNRPLSTQNQLMDWQQGYGLYSDNVTAVDGVKGYRLWFDAPDSGDIVLGPRTGINYVGVLRIKARNIKLEAGTSKFFNLSAIGTDAAGYLVDGSANFIKNNTSTQTANFNISGTGALGGNLTVGGNEIVTGSVTSTGFYQSSLRALKMNIKTCELNASRIIDSLKIREFEYKKDPGKKVVGIIADDEPSIVSGEKHDHLDMMNAVGLLLKSVQELNARVEKLEQQINKEHTSK